MKRSNIDIFKSATGGVLSLVSVLLVTHYFLSYRYWMDAFEKYGLSAYAILSMEDILFPLGRLNMMIFAPSVLAVVIINVFLFRYIFKEKSDNWKEYAMFVFILIFMFVSDCLFKEIFMPNSNVGTNNGAIFLTDGTKIPIGNELHLIFYGTRYIILSDTLNNTILLPVSSVKKVDTYGLLLPTSFNKH